MRGRGTPRRTTSTSRASRSRVTPGRTGRGSPCSSARARSIRTTRTRGPRSGRATTTRGSTVPVGAKRSGDRKRRSDRRRPWIQAIFRPPCSAQPPGRCGASPGRLRHCPELVARRPDSGEAHFALAYVLRYGGLLEDSARECDEAISRDPTNPLFRTCSATFLQLGRYDRALDFVRLDSGSEWSRLVTRWVYQRMGRRDDAREQHRQQAPELPQRVGARELPRLHRALSLGRLPTGAGRLSQDDVRTFLDRAGLRTPLLLRRRPAYAATRRRRSGSCASQSSGTTARLQRSRSTPHSP